MARGFLARFCAALCLLALVGAAPAMAQDVLVFAAASMKNALDDAGAAYAQRTGKKAAFSLAASSALAKQIESGAPADLFASADLDWMDYLDQRGLIRPGTRSNLLGNRLVLIAPANATTAIRIAPGFDLARALGDGRLAMADPASVPAGKYGRAALEALGAWPGVQAKVASAENVRAALALVSRGETPLGIVYETDAIADKGVRIVDRFPPESHPPIVYPVAVTKDSRNPDAAGLLAFLRSPEAAAIFERHGFTSLAPTQ